MSDRPRRILPPPLEKPEAAPSKHPWVVPVIAVVAGVVVVVGVVWASLLGHLF